MLDRSIVHMCLCVGDDLLAGHDDRDCGAGFDFNTNGVNVVRVRKPKVCVYQFVCTGAFAMYNV